MAKVLAFGEDLLRDPRNIRHLLVHCHMGISRSTASMALLLAQAQPSVEAGQILAQVLAIRDKAWPNLRVLTFGDEQLGRHGELVRAAGAVYKLQLERRPQIKDFFMQAGRGREVELALAA